MFTANVSAQFNQLSKEDLNHAYAKKQANFKSLNGTSTYIPTINTNNASKKAANMSDESGYFYQNGFVMAGQTNNFFQQGMKERSAGISGTETVRTYSEAVQFVPNTADLTLDSLSFLGSDADTTTGSTADVVVLIQDKNLTYVTHEFVTIGDFGKYTAVFATAPNFTDSFYITITPFDSQVDSFGIALTLDYSTLPLPYDGNGLIVEWDATAVPPATPGFVAATLPGDGGGDWIMWPAVSYTFEDVTTTTTCLTSLNQSVTFDTENEGLLVNPIWNYNAWAIAQGAPISSGFYYTEIDIAQQPLNDTTQSAGYTHVFPAPGTNTINYTERIYPWGQTASIDQTTVINLGLCTGIDDVANANATSTYPNPAKNSINFQIANENANLTVVDLTGKTVLTENLRNKVNAVNVSQLANGFYVYSVQSNDGTITTGNFVVNK